MTDSNNKEINYTSLDIAIKRSNDLEKDLHLNPQNIEF
ncbi:Uncharacterised protein [Sphingobacterium multivorum]|nr:Uncharacterised protein [Sphingobacterium multivorum]